MKKLAVVLACAVCALGLVACGAKSDNGKSDNNTTNNQSAEKGYTFTSNGYEIVINTEVSDLESAMGAAVDVKSSAACANDGTDRNYRYDGFSVITNQENGKSEVITGVIFNDDTVKTAEGISLGASTADVTAAYGNDFEDVNGNMIYSKGNMKLIFIVKDDKVTSIQYDTKMFD